VPRLTSRWRRATSEAVALCLVAGRDTGSGALAVQEWAATGRSNEVARQRPAGLHGSRREVGNAEGW
jgi:hypothetical protein